MVQIAEGAAYLCLGGRVQPTTPTILSDLN